MRTFPKLTKKSNGRSRPVQAHFRISVWESKPGKQRMSCKSQVLVPDNDAEAAQTADMLLERIVEYLQREPVAV